MYSSVPTTAPNCVDSDSSVSRPEIALATPKSMTLGTPRPSMTVTRMLAGLRSRWTTPFWWACCTAWQTEANSSRRLADAQPGLVAEAGQRQAVDQFHDEERPAIRRQAAVEDAGDVGVVHEGQGLPLLLEALHHRLGVHAGLDELQRHLALDRLGLFGDPDLAHAALADLLDQRVAARDDRAGRRRPGGGPWCSPGAAANPRCSPAVPGPAPRRPVQHTRGERVPHWSGSGAAGGRSSRLPGFSWAASSASTAARSSGRPAHARSRKAARSSGGRDNASWNRVSSVMAVPRMGTVRVRTPCDERASPASPIFRVFHCEAPPSMSRRTQARA